MFHRLIHLLMCLTVLVCPAMGGQCCGGAEDLETAAPAVDACQHCSCGDAAESTKQPSPVVPQYPDQCPIPCHDCFCAGALPPAFETPDPQIDCAAFVGFILVSLDTPMPAGLDRGLADGSELGVGFRPPSGRALLTSYCTLLL